MKFSKVILCTLVVFAFQQISAQSDFLKNSTLTANYHFGVAIPEYSFITHLVDKNVQSFTLDFAKQTNGKTDWERLYKHPEYGFSFYHTTFGNDEVLGKAFALNYFFKVNFISKERFKVYNQTGIGAGYITKKFHLEDNFKNVGIGSHVNVHFNCRVGTSYLLTKKFTANAGVSFDHFSNGNTGDPNLGLNNVALFAGVRYQVGELEKKNTDVLSPFVRSNNFEFVASAGAKQTRAIASDFFFTSSITGGINRAFFRGVHLGIGADVFYDESIKTQMESRGETHNSINDFQTGIHIAQEFKYNRFSLILQEGLYLGLTNKGIRKPMYNRGIVQFQLNKHILLRVAMKSHLHILDFPEVGIGIKW